jgi:hypothetical protein
MSICAERTIDPKFIVAEMREPLYEVNIDFDEASKAWYANKKRMPNSMCRYICLGITKKGNACNRKPLIHSDYCYCHS